MTINIELDLILQKNLTPNQFTLLYTLYHDRLTFNILSDVIGKDNVLSELKLLEESGYITILTDIDNIVINTVFLELISTDNATNYFEEFLELYPVKVLRTDGMYDYLRTDISRCKKKYNQLINGKKNRHEKMIGLLKYELKVRQQENSMKYMKRLPKWLTSEEWKVFEDRRNHEIEKPELKSAGYGTTLI